MKYIILCVASIVLLHAQSQKAIIELEKQRYVAMTENDQPFLQKILADDLIFTHANGVVESKTSFLQRLNKKDLIYRSIQLQDVKAKIYENCAVVTGTSNIIAQGGKQKVNLSLRFTTVYILNKAKKWKVVAYQSTRIIQMNKKS
ncbi:nuclear transport factor 2 family protein [Candidatus Uabimicrobium amorphum]|uniref:DUF4440 domain-containing protein n=1 Tax=Uabimicrobium amorphum TaxID=2596890 RepID=A0A5S9IPT5_UABAM|nr:nuclear transport factor 2 family protein [Candidatus Uabimicrobium amorphum]BBM85396.1 hypothetical protein UABAM_03763 [Candidatus Uabimicrobium amorphum]